MDQREIEWRIYILEEERDTLNSSLKELSKKLEDKSKSEKELDEIEVEYFDLIDDIDDINCDIAVYQEMLDKLYTEEEETQNFVLHDEVFTDGDY